MSRIGTLAFVVIALGSAACLRSTTYQCASASQCTGDGGRCESTGFCSFSDPACGGGQRYGNYAGDLSNTCVDESLPMPDGGQTPDAPTAGGCPGTYAGVSGQTHRYRVIATTASYMTQKAACAADATNGVTAYLAVPADQTELDAIIAAATTQLAWIGIDDIVVEDQYVPVTGGTFDANSPLWETGEPDNAPRSGGGQADCVSASSSGNQLADDKCGNAYAAVCECEP